MLLRIVFRWFLIAALLLGVALIWSIFSTSTALAQCDTPPKSSCLSCHVQVDHLDGMGEWNNVHVTQDMCTSCHGGNGTAMEEDLAHEGVMAQPLSDIYTNCHSCHPIDYQVKSSQFAATISVTTSSCTTPTPIPLNKASGGLPPGSNAMLRPVSKITASNYLGPIIGWLASLVFFSLGLLWIEKHRVEGKY